MASTLVVKPWVHAEFRSKSRKSVTANKIVANDLVANDEVFAEERDLEIEYKLAA